MRGWGLLPFAARFAWRYAAAAALVAGLAVAMIGVAAGGTGPMPQQPPDGYSVASGRISLEWNRGTRKGPITLQISVNDSSFSKPILMKTIGGISHLLTDVRPGSTYYWRLVQGGEPSPTATFEVSASYVDF